MSANLCEQVTVTGNEHPKPGSGKRKNRKKKKQASNKSDQGVTGENGRDGQVGMIAGDKQAAMDKSTSERITDSETKEQLSLSSKGRNPEAIPVSSKSGSDKKRANKKSRGQEKSTASAAAQFSPDGKQQRFSDDPLLGEAKELQAMSDILDVYSHEFTLDEMARILSDENQFDAQKLLHIKSLVERQHWMITGKNRVLEQQAKENIRMRALIEEYGEKLALQEHQMEQQQQQVNMLKMELENLRRQMRTKDFFIKSAEKENTQLSEDLTASTASLGAVGKDMKALVKQLAYQENDMAKLHGEMERLAAEKDVHLAKIDRYESEREMLLADLVNGPVRKENRCLKSQLGEAQTELASANQSLQDLEEELAALTKLQKRVQQSQRVPSALSVESGENMVEGQGEREESEGVAVQAEDVDERREPSAGQSGGVRNPFIPAELRVGSASRAVNAQLAKGSSPATRASEFQLGSPTSFWDVGETTATGFQVPKALLYQGAETKDAEVAVQAGLTAWSSAQTSEVEVLEASTWTEAQVVVVRETKDALVQTEGIAPGSRCWEGIFTVIIMLCWAAILLWSHKEDQKRWLAANDVSRTALIGLRGRSLGPFPWLEKLRYSLNASLQLTRGRLG
jgi:hypothetical protein